jgi:hypothetical protein
LPTTTTSGPWANVTGVQISSKQKNVMLLDTTEVRRLFTFIVSRCSR